MNKLRLLRAVTIVSAATVASAATHPFYAQMLQRGVANAQRGKYAEAAKELRIAAFGLLEDAAGYQTAQVHLALAYEKLGRAEESRLAATKFLQVERASKAYETLPLDAATRTAFETIVAKAVEPDALAEVPSFRRSTPPQVSAVASVAAPVMPAVSPSPDASRLPSPAQRERVAPQEPGEGLKQQRAKDLETARLLHRAGQWQESAFIYQRLQPFRAGEELHMFFEAVNRYELGERAVARRLLMRALPKLPNTREVASYRAKIESGL